MHNHHNLMSFLRRRTQQRRQSNVVQTQHRTVRDILDSRQTDCDKQRGISPAYILALQWPPSVCTIFKSCRFQFVQEKTWTLHGLWPRKTCDETCSSDFMSEWRKLTDDARAKPLIRQINLLWPDIKAGRKDNASAMNLLVKNEWQKHGYCNYPSFKDYVAKAIELAQKYNPQLALKWAEVTPRVRPIGFVRFSTALARGMRNKYGIKRSQFYLVCSSTKFYQCVLEVRVCLDQNQQPTMCLRSEEKDSGCHTSRPIFYPT